MSETTTSASQEQSSGHDAHEPQEVLAMRNAFSGSILETRDHAVQNYFRQKQHPELEEMKRIGSVRFPTFSLNIQHSIYQTIFTNTGTWSHSN